MARAARKPPRKHRWEFDNGPRRKKSVVWTKGHWSRKEVPLSMTLDDLEQSIQLNGVGDGHNCAGAFCADRHEAVFPHAVVGYVDFQDSRVYVASRLDRTALPSDHYVYKHNTDIARLFDTAAGREELRRRLRKGPIEFTLYPTKYDPIAERERASGKHRAIPKPRKKHVARTIRRELEAA